MRLTAILIISCLILSTHAKIWRAKSSKASSKTSSAKAPIASIGRPGARPLLNFPQSSPRFPPRTPGPVFAQPRIPSAPPLPGHVQPHSSRFPPSAPDFGQPNVPLALHLPKNHPSSKTRIPPPPPLPRKAAPPKRPVPNNRGSRGPPKPVSAATSRFTPIVPLSTSPLLIGSTLARRHNSTSKGNSTRNNTAQLRPVANWSPKVNNTQIGDFRQSSFNNPIFQKFPQNNTGNALQNGAAKNVTRSPFANVGNRNVTQIGKRNQTLTGNAFPGGVNKNMTQIAKKNQTSIGNAFPGGVNKNMTQIAKTNQTSNGSGFIQVIPPRNNTRLNFNGNGFARGLGSNATRVNFTQNFNGTGFAKGPGVNATRFNNTVNISKIGTQPVSTQRGNTNFNPNSSPPGAGKWPANDPFVGGTNSNNPPPNQQMPSNVNNGQNNVGDNKNDGTGKTSKTQQVKDMAKKVFDAAVKKFSSKNRSDAPKKTSFSANNQMNARATPNEYGWKSAVDPTPSKPTTTMRNQIIIISISVIVVLLAFGILVYYCNRK